MIHSIINKKEYRDITSKQVKELLDFLKREEKDFSITANLSGVVFSPEIPSTIKKYFTPYTLFSLANYTLQSLELYENHITFEAGFGEESFGSLCKIPYYAIFQLSIDNSILYVNPTATVEKYFTDEEEQLERSRSSFKLNR
jgi:hypothetical protein